MARLLTEIERAFIASCPVARLATADRHGVPHVVPICFIVIDDALYFSVDEKPKRPSMRPLKRLRNIAENPRVAVIVDRYCADWRQLGWVALHGCAEIVSAGSEHKRAQTALKRRYPQYQDMTLAGLPVVAVRIARVVAWGKLDPEVDGG